uniref:NYN domain-containing protein n=1 Tax=Chromera velia CCMP2878 TaxID=1169474 RepID=A0A0G4HST4_9ALVE|eukprot:Cvel_1320.t1-p1 / transcript=Cvel_1320.t1 / gene=Cvel_1320 / organism=Chromera_velia_CCMP2878 / gene_product=hypothetical protein / transcript_product=hypothetical protein / location=Cvel_scaffold45:46532-46987(+) / protein_length=152 / sequence_SO=supercontig / SO=protein_coding / is_pseudo=false
MRNNAAEGGAGGKCIITEELLEEYRDILECTFCLCRKKAGAVDVGLKQGNRWRKIIKEVKGNGGKHLFVLISRDRDFFVELQEATDEGFFVGVVWSGGVQDAIKHFLCVRNIPFQHILGKLGAPISRYDPDAEMYNRGYGDRLLDKRAVLRG